MDAGTRIVLIVATVVTFLSAAAWQQAEVAREQVRQAATELVAERARMNEVYAGIVANVGEILVTLTGAVDRQQQPLVRTAARIVDDLLPQCGT